MNSGLNLYTIPADSPFIAHLAGWILKSYGHDPAALTKILVLLPNRRSCRSLREAFLAATGGQPMLFPRIQPLGDVETLAIPYETLNTDLPPAISGIRREFLLTRLVMDFKKSQQGRVFTVEQAADLARQLAALIDDVHRHGLSFDRLAQLVPDELAVHWQQTLDFLHIVSHQWPAILAAENALDPVDRRNRELLAIADAWRNHPPDYPVIAAGSTGSTPATARLLGVIASLPEGRMILPGLDTDMPEAEWQALSETHPQFGMKQLLEGMTSPSPSWGEGRTSPSPWKGEGGVGVRHARELIERLPLQSTPTLTLPLSGGGDNARLATLRAILQSPEATARWSHSPLPLAEGLRRIRLLSADTLHDEARMIAIALREALETPGRTAALVTPDRTLARMVSAQMQRFGVAIDDSAGHALNATPAGCFLRLLIDMAASQAAPVELLALLRHPLAAAGYDTARCRLLSRRLETELLRGLRRAPGLEALRDATPHDSLKQPLDALAQNLRPLFECFRHKEIPLYRMLDAHIACAEWLAATDVESGPARLWAGEGGSALAELLAELREHADLLDTVDPASYAGLFGVMLSGHSYYPRFGLHPRLHILSPIEARLQHFDRVILGGLNEGTWPAPPETDPWMSRPMREAFGLPSTARAVGQSAHDVYLLCAGGDALLTRSRKIDGTPTVPSRWLVRLETLVSGSNPALYAAMDVSADYAHAMQLLDSGAPLPPLARPHPAPPLAARPRRLHVTAIDHWLADPYRVYARHILDLRKLHDLDQDPTAADFGNLVHNTLERFVQRWPEALPEQPYEALIECGREAFADMLAFPAVASLWWPRFESMAGWVIEREIACRGMLRKVVAESKGRWDFDLDGKPFTLTTRIDRLEYLRDGGIAIADYKTGAVPSAADIEQGRKNQLLLEALIVMHGHLEPALEAKLPVSKLEYWKLSGRGDAAKIQPVDIAHIDAAKTRLEALIRHYDHETTAYAPPPHVSSQHEQYNDYRHLTRRAEWGDA